MKKTKGERPEAALREEVAWLWKMIQESRDGIVVLDENGKVEDANIKFARNLGYSLEEVLELSVWDWDDQWDKEHILGMIEDLDEAGDRFVTRHRRKDGSLLDVEISTSKAVRYGRKMVFCICRDITRRIRSEKALRESQARLAALSDASFESIFLSDQGLCLDQNLTAERMFGYTREEAVGRYGMEWIIPEHRDRVKANMISGYEKPYEVTALRKNGSTFPAEIQGRMIESRGKKIRITALRDISERKQAQAEKMEALAEAAESKKLALVGQIAGKMAHDFNNTLGIIMGNAELALIGCQDPGTRETLELIFDQTLRGQNLTKNLVAFAKDQEPKQEYFPVNQKIELVLNLLKRDLEKIHLIREYGPRGPDLLADPGMIEHALVNILQNAIHATSRVERPEIIIRTYHRKDQVCIEIQDNGCGIPERFLEKIFEPSFTLKGSRDESGSYAPGIKGTGYGMANVKKYVDQHKGRINLVSKIKKGTKIRISLPVIQKELTAEEKEDIDNGKLSSGKYILLVEDEPAISGVQYKILTQKPCNHRVDIAGNGQIAVDLFDRNDYDLVSLDYILPGGLNGMDVYHHIRKTDRIVPILFISGNIEFLESIKELKQNDPYIDHLSKPCRNLDYVGRINRLMTSG
ncbi:hybrid sensor histidine kinase/response regulator [Desulfospira joergensenii]|uniref:hybrid sensor histidine kinase/response regulator n=1 Tax=Desulfospira joergensenii TaxID=53329 RepID=UPI0003B56871|nr:PAS domain-containing sensor histidine kinase [Desulfospira joergensenii]